jgi:hypothetical protein
LPAASVIRQLAHNGLSLAAKDGLAVREQFEPLEAREPENAARLRRA